MITQDYILKGGLKSSDDAANAAIAGKRASADAKAQQDAELAKLIKGKDMDEAGRISGDARKYTNDQSAVDANMGRVEAQMRKHGIDPSKTSMNFNESGGGYNPDTDPMGKTIKKALMGANITGYNVADPDRVIPTMKDAEEVKKATGSLKTLQATGVGVQNQLDSAGPLDRFGSVRIPFTSKHIGTEKGISLDSGLTDMVLQLKELANLGAITGPDMALMESAMGQVTGLGSLVGDKSRGVKQLSDVLSRARSKVESNATSRGYAPHQGYLDSPKTDTQKKTQDAPSFEQWKAMKAGR